MYRCISRVMLSDAVMSAVDVVLFDQCEAQATGETAKCQPPAPAGLSCDVWKPGLWQSPTILIDVVELVERLNGAKMNSAGSTVAISLAVHERGLMFADVVW